MHGRSTIAGFILYVVGGWLFALLYFALFASIQKASWWLGAALGFLLAQTVYGSTLGLFAQISQRVVGGGG